ncbi:MAG: hypothetical protein JMDDDDMK_05128 [Acidobacteria bacterium]|nr:hypothetical protein [Acidobacteriota bacterium]
MSSIGLGSYLGNPDEQADEAYRNAVKRAAEFNRNVFDTATNYRYQRSERSIGMERRATNPSRDSIRRRNRFVAAPIDLGPATDQVFLILYGAGFHYLLSKG